MENCLISKVNEMIKVSTFIRYLFILKLVLQQFELVMDLKYF